VFAIVTIAKITEPYLTIHVADVLVERENVHTGYVVRNVWVNPSSDNIPNATVGNGAHGTAFRLINSDITPNFRNAHPYSQTFDIDESIRRSLSVSCELCQLLMNRHFSLPRHGLGVAARSWIRIDFAIAGRLGHTWNSTSKLSPEVLTLRRAVRSGWGWLKVKAAAADVV
jgi:hypothetical protein